MIVTDACGRPLDAPLNVEAEVAWAGLRQRAHPRASRAAAAAGAARARVDGGRDGGAESDASARPPASRRSCETLRERRLFERGASIAVSRAPGRLDVMGGIADYSGSLVLERPIAEATWAAVQRVDRPVLEIVSLGRPPCSDPARTRWRPAARRSRYDAARQMFAQGPSSAGRPTSPASCSCWRASAGCRLTSGARIVVASQVPEGKGVSSSAAVETATHGGRRGRVRDRARAARPGAAVPDGREPRRRCAVRRDGPDDVRVRRRATRCWRCCASLRNCRRRCPFPTNRICGASIRASVTRWAAPTTAPSAPGRSWVCGCSPSTRGAGRVSGQHRARDFERELAQYLPEEMSRRRIPRSLRRHRGHRHDRRCPDGAIACVRRRRTRSTSAARAETFRELLLASAGEARPPAARRADVRVARQLRPLRSRLARGPIVSSRWCAPKVRRRACMAPGSPAAAAAAPSP